MVLRVEDELPGWDTLAVQAIDLCPGVLYVITEATLIATS